MKLRYIYLLMLTMLISSCAERVQEKEILAVSIEPQRYFLEQIVGDKYDVETILSAGSDPETFEPSLSQRMAIAKAKAFVTIGNFPFESSLAENLKQDNPDIIISNCSEGIKIINGTHIHADKKSHSGYDDADPHVWTSVANARIIAANMLAMVSKLDSLNKDFYNANYSRLISRLDSIDRCIQSKLAVKSADTFIVWHPSLSYFARDYNLHQISVGQEGKESTVEHIHNAVELAKNSDAKVFFFQNEYDSRQAQLINKEIGTTLVTINPLSYDWDQQILQIAYELSK